MSCSALTWSLDALVAIAIVVNLTCVVILRRKTTQVEGLIGELRFKGEELERARASLIALAQRYGFREPFATAVDAYVDLHLGDENGRRS